MTGVQTCALPIYNAIVVAEKYARGMKAKQDARAGIAAALKLGLCFKHDTDDK